MKKQQRFPDLKTWWQLATPKERQRVADKCDIHLTTLQGICTGRTTKYDRAKQIVKAARVDMNPLLLTRPEIREKMGAL